MYLAVTCWPPQVLSTSSSSQPSLEWVPRVYASSPIVVQCTHNIATGARATGARATCVPAVQK